MGSERLPKLSIFLFGGYFNNSRFIYNSGRSVALFYNTNDPGLITLLLLYIFTIGGRLFSGQTNQEST